MKTVAIIQARLGSSRLPAKVLLPLPTGRTVIEEVIHRAKQINGVDEVVVAIPEKDAAILERYISVRCVKGSETDVLSRYWMAAKEAEADVIVRITADCPMLNPTVCSEVVALRARSDVDYASNIWPARSFPQGFDCEVFTMDALQRANDSVGPMEVSMGPIGRDEKGGFLTVWNTHHDNAYDREHVTPWMQRNCRIALHKAMDDRSGERLTLDRLQDYRHIYQVMQDELTADHRAA